jgi:hypothetical protein
MVGYDPKRPKPAAGDDSDPAPVEALIDLADRKSPEDPPRQEPASPARGPSGEGGPQPQEPPGESRAADPASAQQGVSSGATPQDHTAGRRSRLVLSGVLAACAVVLLVLALRRRRS